MQHGAAEMKHWRQIIETIMISLMGRVTSARGPVTMLSGGGTRPYVESARRQILILHILQCSILAPSSRFSFIGHISSHFIV